MRPNRFLGGKKHPSSVCGPVNDRAKVRLVQVVDFGVLGAEVFHQRTRPHALSSDLNQELVRASVQRSPRVYLKHTISGKTTRETVRLSLEC